MSSPQSAASDTASTNPPDGRLRTIMRGSLTQRMIVIADAWLLVLLAGGAFALDRGLTNAITCNYDATHSYEVQDMIDSAQTGPSGEGTFSRTLGVPECLEPSQGVYSQATASDD